MSENLILFCCGVVFEFIGVDLNTTWNRNLESQERQFAAGMRRFG